MDVNDQTQSVRRMLYRLFVDQPDVHVELERTRRLIRPQVRVERTAHQEVSLGAGAYRDDCQFAITYYGRNGIGVDGRQDVDKFIAHLQAYIENGGTDYSNLYAIQGWRFGWQFPQPLDLSPSASVVGTIPAGTYQVRISGIDECGDESAASTALPVTLNSPGTIYFRIPRVPWIHPVFPSYNFYVNGHLEGNVLMPKFGYPTVSLTTLLGTGAAPLEAVNPDGSPNTVRWRWMRVTRFSSDVREDMITNGDWQTTITLETSVIQPRRVPQTDVVQQIEFDIGTGDSTMVVQVG